MDSGIDTVVSAIRRAGGVATWAELSAEVTQHAVRTAVSSGAVIRVARGVYSLGDAADGPAVAAALRGSLSHVSAAEHWGLEPLRPADGVHVTVPRRANPGLVPRRVRLHWCQVAGADDLGYVTSPLRTVLDCAATLPVCEGLAIADAALRRQIIDLGDLRERARQRRGVGALRARWIADHADPRAANAFESGLRTLVLMADGTGFQPQLPICLPGGTVFVDLGDPRRRIVAEADSFAFHGSREALHRDCTRYDELVRHGWTVLRFSYDHVLHEADWVRRLLADVLAIRDHRHQPRNRTVPGPRHAVE